VLRATHECVNQGARGSRLRVGGRARNKDFFNLLNHPQFGEPIGDPLNANFGRITRTSVNNRTVQLGLHFYY
jgi:hypothetical protein